MLLKITPFLGTHSQGRPGIWPTYYYSKYIDTSWGPYRAYAFLKKQDNRAGLGVCKAYGCKRVRNFSRRKQKRRVEVHLRQMTSIKRKENNHLQFLIRNSRHFRANKTKTFLNEGFKDWSHNDGTKDEGGYPRES